MVGIYCDAAGVMLAWDSIPLAMMTREAQDINNFNPILYDYGGTKFLNVRRNRR